jgi:predicted P-loop ATPase
MTACRSDDKKPLVVIGTSGSTDYLRDVTAGKRFWPVVVVPPSDEEPIRQDHVQEIE